MLLFPLFLVMTTFSWSTNGIVAATPVISSNINSGSVGNGDNNNANGDNNINNDSNDTENEVFPNSNEDERSIDNTNDNTDDNINNGNSDNNAIPPVQFSFLPVSNPDSISSSTDTSTDADTNADPSSSIVSLTLDFSLMFPAAAETNPLLRSVYKAYYSFDDGPIDAEWATFQGGPPGLAKTKCTIEGRDDFEITNFMREGEVRYAIRNADYIWCVTSL